MSGIGEVGRKDFSHKGRLTWLKATLVCNRSKFAEKKSSNLKRQYCTEKAGRGVKTKMMDLFMSKISLMPSGWICRFPPSMDRRTTRLRWQTQTQCSHTTAGITPPDNLADFVPFS